MRASEGISLGMANVAGEVRIAGPLARPEVGLDPDAAPGTVARVGAAVLTAGLSILATAVWDAAVPASDACQAVFLSSVEKSRNGAAKHTAPR